MHDQSSAAEHLRVIRSLMERATIYRAISTPTALVGGLLGVGTGLWLSRHSEKLGARSFIEIWVAVMAVTLLANTYLIWRKSRRERGPLITSGLKWAIQSALPVVLLAAVITALFWRHNETAESLPALVVIWISCYGLALLTTVSFSPRSLVVLGWSFLGSGALGMIFLTALFAGNSAARANFAMAFTFGAFHLIYAALSWPRSAQAE